MKLTEAIQFMVEERLAAGIVVTNPEVARLRGYDRAAACTISNYGILETMEYNYDNNKLSDTNTEISKSMLERDDWVVIDTRDPSIWVDEPAKPTNEPCACSGCATDVRDYDNTDINLAAHQAYNHIVSWLYRSDGAYDTRNEWRSKLLFEVSEALNNLQESVRKKL